MVLVDKYLEPPFSVLDGRSKRWQENKKAWISKGIKSELGRTAKTYNFLQWAESKRSEGKLEGHKLKSDISIFDPYLTEVIYLWFCPTAGKILDPFAGGSVRGLVAKEKGYNYLGVELRAEQVESNEEQALNFKKSVVEKEVDLLSEVEEKKQVEEQKGSCKWIVGDSNQVLDSINEKFDFLFSCPPYFNLEKYSDDENDLSNMSIDDFKDKYFSIISKACGKLKKDCYACFVVGEVRKKDGSYLGLVPLTIQAFEKAGLSFYNEAIFLTPLGSSAIRAEGSMKNKKLVKVHQNILVFRKG